MKHVIHYIFIPQCVPSLKAFFRKRVVREEAGVMTLEWILLVVVLCVGIVGGMATMRDAVIYRFFKAADAVGAVNPSYTINEYRSYNTQEGAAAPLFTAPASSFGGEQLGSSTDLTTVVRP